MDEIIRILSAANDDGGGDDGDLCLAQHDHDGCMTCCVYLMIKHLSISDPKT